METLRLLKEAELAAAAVDGTMVTAEVRGFGIRITGTIAQTCITGR